MSEAATPAASPAAPAAPAPSAPAPSTPAAAPAAAPAASPAPAPAAAPAAATPATPAATPDPAAQAAGAKATEPPAATGAPETYEAFKAPDGVTLNDAVVSEFSTVAKELNLSQANAQILVDKLAPIIAKQNSESITSALAKADTEWQAASKADAEIGGVAFDANVAVARTAIEQYGTPEFKQFLNDSRLGNHPEWIRFAYRAGKAISPDGKVVTGAAPGQGATALADKLWPSQPTQH